MGDFAKASTDPGNILAAVAIIGGAIIGGPVGALAAASAVGAVSATTKATGAREVELELAQRKEETASRDREVQRKERIIAILGAQSAQAAASGLAMSGSVGNISIADAQRAGRESLVDDVNTRGRIDALKRNRKTISRLSSIRTATTILGAGERIAARG